MTPIRLADAERHDAIVALKHFVDILREVANCNVCEGCPVFPDAEGMRALLARACAQIGTSVEACYRALESDAELQDLAEQSVRAIALDTPDPGPYDQLSSRDPFDSWERAHEPPRTTLLG